MAIPAIFFLLGGLGTFFMLIGVVIFILFGISYMLLVWFNYSQWAFDRFINPNMGIATGRGLYNKEKGKESVLKKITFGLFAFILVCSIICFVVGQIGRM